MADPILVELSVNGIPRTAHAEPRTTLADFLREQLRLTGTHVGCEHGVCGACTVELDGTTVRSCLMFAVQAQGRRVVTVEGLADDDHGRALQAAFKAEHALQCGFCTPGFLLAARELLGECEPAELSDERVREGISGNLCRCTGYGNIVSAIQRAARLPQ